MQEYSIFNPVQKKKRENNLVVLILTIAILIIAGFFFYLAFHNLFISPKLTPSAFPKEEFSSPQSKEEKNKECPRCQPGEKLYKVEKDDTLWTIGEKFKIDWQLIAERNGLTEPYLIKVGDEIIIPLPSTEEK